VPFNVTFQTTTTTGRQFPAPAAAAARRLGAIAGFFSSTTGGSAGSGDSGGPRNQAARELAAAVLLALTFFSLVWLVYQTNLSRKVKVFGLTFAVAICAALGGCHHTTSTANVIPYTPTGTYTLTVHGFVQNASRGFTMMLVVDD